MGQLEIPLCQVWVSTRIPRINYRLPLCYNQLTRCQNFILWSAVQEQIPVIFLYGGLRELIPVRVAIL